jgi:hydrogenase maturation protein HypF
VALSVGPQVFISQHIGDLETTESFGAFQRVIADFGRLYAAPSTVVAADLHPDYLSTRLARQRASNGVRFRGVQHHYAHVLSCMAENQLDPPVLGVAWDGTGYGLDGTVWGGEFLRVTEDGFQRVAHWRTFSLPGGDVAVREPRRAALGLLYELFGDAVFDMSGLSLHGAFTSVEWNALRPMMRRRINVPKTSSVGRLFDAVASMVGLRQVSRFEGQAAMELEFALEGCVTDAAYPVRLDGDAIDWEPMMGELLDDLKRGESTAVLSAKFHNGLVEAIISVARRTGEEKVVLSGGCFQNACLTERAVRRLTQQGFRPYWHQRVPPNDGGLALGQVVAALRMPVEEGAALDKICEVSPLEL